MTTKIEPASEKRKPPAAGKGRPKGAVNKTTKALKDMILQALDGAGGINYLQAQATSNPTAFLTLVGKVLPLDVNASHSGQIVAQVTFKGLNG
jgi:hypothetical protein